jgi:hypothetical protein
MSWHANVQQQEISYSSSVITDLQDHQVVVAAGAAQGPGLSLVAEQGQQGLGLLQAQLARLLLLLLLLLAAASA